MRALDAQCASKLRQYGQALAIYRHEYGGDGVYGHPYAMGLPPDGGRLDLPREVYYCPLGEHAHNTFVPWPDSDTTRRYLDAWVLYVRQWKEEAIVRGDLNHNAGGVPSGSPYREKKGIGLYLGGNVRVLVKIGDPSRYEFWN